MSRVSFDLVVLNETGKRVTNVSVSFDTGWHFTFGVFVPDQEKGYGSSEVGLLIPTKITLTWTNEEGIPQSCSTSLNLEERERIKQKSQLIIKFRPDSVETQIVPSPKI